MYEYKQVIVLRKDLNMRKGKMVAQGAHASMAAILNNKFTDNVSILQDERVINWLNGRFAKICVSVDTQNELFTIHDKAKNAGLPCSLIEDAGFTEFKEPTFTAVAVGPGLIDEVDKITKELKLL
jgi:PTH2 family peptidyl-tRNA hydrolase